MKYLCLGMSYLLQAQSTPMDRRCSLELPTPYLTPSTPVVMLLVGTSSRDK